MKTLSKILEVYDPKPKDERRFKEKHVVVKHEDPAGNKDDVFNASNIKMINRNTEHGYNPGQDEQVYEKTLTPAEVKKREQVAKALARENPKMDKSKKMAIATATAKRVAESVDEAIIPKSMQPTAAGEYKQRHDDVHRLMAGISKGLAAHSENASKQGGIHWGHVGDVTSIHRQLQDIHDRLHAQGEYSKGAHAVRRLGESVEMDDDTDAFLSDLFDQLDEDSQQAFQQMVDDGQVHELLQMIDDALGEEEDG